MKTGSQSGEGEGPEARDLCVPESPREIFVAFTIIAMQSFGGALAFIERMIVRKKRWLTMDEFVGMHALSQVLPGPTGLSFCVLLGDRFFGVRGAVAALSGFMLLPTVLILGIATLFLHFQHLPQVQGALHGMGAASVGLIVITAARMARTLRGRRVAIGVAVLGFCAVGLLRLPVSTVMLTLGTVSVWLAWRIYPK